MLLGACRAAGGDAPSAPAEPARAEGPEAEPISPLPLEIDVDGPLSLLGESLFYSPILSDDGKVACAGCHSMEHALADGSAHTEVLGRPRTLTNSITLFNVRYFYKLTWSGSADNIGAHLDSAIKDPGTMGASWDSIAHRLSTTAPWPTRFQSVFRDGVTPDNVRRALIEYQRSLVTPNAPFDRWLRGDSNALTPEATRGYALFKDYGCISCHQGIAVGANMLQRFGVMRDYFANRQKLEAADLGRFSFTHREEDRHVFRVPSLRNVAVTAPYFHDGSAPTLEAAVAVMADYQLGRTIPTGDIAAIVAFLRSLTGEYRGTSL